MIAGFVMRQGRRPHGRVPGGDCRAELQRKRDICRVERQLAALGGRDDPLQQDVVMVKSSIAALQCSDARQNREVQQLMTGMKRLKAATAEQ
jgi:hypothetical protein